MPFYSRGLGGAIQHIYWGLWFWTVSIANPVGEVWKHAGLRSTCIFPGQALLNMQNYKNTQTIPVPYVMWSNVHLQKHFLIFKVFCGCKFQYSFTLCFIIMESERNYCQVGRYFLKPSFNICTYCNALVRSGAICRLWPTRNVSEIPCFHDPKWLSDIKHHYSLICQAWDNNFLIYGSNLKSLLNYL